VASFPGAEHRWQVDMVAGVLGLTREAVVAVDLTCATL
jgi:hypothetical protein